MTAKTKTTILSLLLLLSLALNVGLVAWVGGKKTGEFGGPRGGFAGSQLLKDTVEGLPPADREAAIAILKEYRPQIRESIDQLRAERDVTRDLLSKPDVDKEAIKAAFATMRERVGKLQQLNQEMVIEMLPHLPAEARVKLLMRKGPPGGPGGPERGSDHGGPRSLPHGEAPPPPPPGGEAGEP